ncbi:hypothetical protein VF21_02759 [Pseudogymnoascus sp. 05NY08]|nr:hypothetical protein VF21_02759 [Pseudogymnoascus sp. 05NY08]
MAHLAIAVRETHGRALFLNVVPWDEGEEPKANIKAESSSAYVVDLQSWNPDTSDILQNNLPALIPNFQYSTMEAGINDHLPSHSDEPLSQCTQTSPYSDSPRETRPANTRESRSRPGKVSNPLALLADASGAAQALDQRLDSATESPASASALSTVQQPYGTTTAFGLASSLLRRPGGVSLGLSLSQASLERGLEAFLTPRDRPYQCSDYFKPSCDPPVLDTGPDLDPIDLGLVTEEEVRALFPIYFARLHPINGILDPDLHTPNFVRSRSALLFTWILAITVQFDPTYSSMAKRLRLHGEKLSKHVHTRGYKSVEIPQNLVSISDIEIPGAAAGAQLRLCEVLQDLLILMQIDVWQETESGRG